uniref:Reverse transcriptase domain-containing protein n=1 Tax=Moniliophthora roreri TaxID=221103 RepID=A0A0W0FNC7_MONRR
MSSLLSRTLHVKGLGLSGASSSTWITSKFPNTIPKVDLRTLPLCPKPHTTFLSTLAQLNLSSFSVHDKFPATTDFLTPSNSSPNVKIVSQRKFKRITRNDPNSVQLLRFFDNTTPTYINSYSTNPESDGTTPQAPPPKPPDQVPEDDYLNYVPNKYMDFADTVFNPQEFEKLPDHRPYDIDIELEEGTTPPFGPMYKLTPQEREAVAEYVHTNLKQGHIRPSTSSAGAPVLFTCKKTGEIRLCVNFRGLNSITKKNRFPLPLVDDLLDSVQGCKIFTVIDLKSAYSHLRIREGDEWKTAFRTHLGLFEHLIVPYGLTNAPAAWQSFIQDVLRDILGLVCVVYLDDILIFSKTQEEHDQHVRLVLERLRNANLCANAKKCEFDKAEVEYLGYITNAEGVLRS